MKKILLVIAALFLLLSCETMSPIKTDTWLDGKQGAVAEFNMAGKWDAGPYMEGGWGEGIFTQNGNRISGTLGPYSVDGVVEGKTVFMSIRGGTKLYTAKLTLQPDGQLTGTYVFNALIGEEGAESAEANTMTLNRINPQQK